MEGINLEKLEAVVEKMLNNINELKREKASLEAKVAAKNATISDLEAKISSMTSNQEEVTSRVSNLLSSIEEWERSAEIETSQEADHEINHEDIPADEHMDDKSSSLFSIGE